VNLRLTEHFTNAELGVLGCDARIVANADFLCVSVLEGIHERFGIVRVHDGYRDTAHNARVGGKPASYHLFDDGHAAADVDAPLVCLQTVFDWLRLHSGLGFDKVILEMNASNVPVCIHVQVDRFKAPRREAYIGHTGAATEYEQVEVQ
jgi:hypothetical protein